MDWTALVLSLKLAAATALVLLPLAILVARELAWRRFAGKAAVEALVALPLVLPPTVLGYYLLVAFAPASAAGQAFAALTGGTLAFSFAGLLAASIVFNLPFAVQPVQRAFEAIPDEVREAGWLCGMSGWRTLWQVELPLAWPGLVSAFVLTFAHTLGEFGVVLMVGGNIPGETRTVAIAIYDRVQALDDRAAGTMSALLLAISFVSIVVIYGIDRARRRRG
jgi:molybdate transport system permease protein